MRNWLGNSVVVVAALGGYAEPLWAADGDLRLPAPTFPVAAALYEAHQPTDALEVLERQLDGLTGDEVPIEAQLLRATLLAGVGRHQEREALWTEIAERESSLTVFALRALVSSLAGRAEPAQAETRLTELMMATSARQQLDLILTVADSHRGAGNFVEAAALYGRVLRSRSRGSFADAARLGLAAAQESAGDLEEAVNTFRQVQLQHHTPKAFTTARAGERRASASLGRSRQRFTEDQYRALARRLRVASQYEESLELLEEWRRAYPQTRKADVIEAETIDTLYSKRDSEEAAARCLQFAERFPRSALLPRVRVVQFRLDARMGRTAEVRSRGYDLWRGRVGGATAGQRRSAGELLAAYLASIGEVEEGLDVYRELYRTAGTARDQRNILWRAGVAALRAGQDERAVINLRGLNNRNPTGELAPAARYWLAVAERRVGKQTEAARLFRALEQRYPYHHYGLLARDRLSDLTTEATASDEDARRRGSATRKFPALELGDRVRRQSDFTAATLLAKAGLKSAAAELTRQVLARNRRNRALALLAARASAEAGDYRSVSTILVNHFGAYLRQPATDLPEDFWRLAYPRPFWEEIQASANTHDVDPILLLALMRQESRFDPQARSPAGAIGLFQIMPYTAAELGPQAGVGHLDGGKDEAALMKPSVNVTIATKLISNLTMIFGRAMPPVIASYNAGEDRVSVWWQAAHGLGEDVFIDSIPYSETRRFVREVLANYSAYCRVYWSSQ